MVFIIFFFFNHILENDAVARYYKVLTGASIPLTNIIIKRI